MCSLVMLRRPGHAWPVLIAANRDELAGRPSLAPARHWPDRPELVAGQDQLAFGSWLGINDHGVAAAVLNRKNTLGPEAGKRSRGELVLDALDHAEAARAAEAAADLDPAAWRPFNLVIADPEDAFWVRHDGETVAVLALPSGLSMLAEGELDDAGSARIRRYRPLFERAAPPEPETEDWADWQCLLGARASETGDPRDAMCIVTGGAYGTRSSSLLALPADPERTPVWLYADGHPDEVAFQPVRLGGA